MLYETFVRWYNFCTFSFFQYDVFCKEFGSSKWVLMIDLYNKTNASYPLVWSVCPTSASALSIAIVAHPLLSTLPRRIIYYVGVALKRRDFTLAGFFRMRCFVCTRCTLAMPLHTSSDSTRHGSDTLTCTSLADRQCQCTYESWRKKRTNEYKKKT